MEELVGAQPQDLDDLGVESLDFAFGELDDQMIERGALTLHAAGDLGGERAIALVVQAGARGRQCGREIGAAGGDGAEDVVGRDARGRDHGVPVVSGFSRTWGSKRWPGIRR